MQLGLGTAALGRPQYINVRQDATNTSNLEMFKKESFSVLEEAYQSGVRYFDTAPGYGLAEQLLIDWLAIKTDDTIKVATKWGYTYTANFNPDAKVHEVKEHSLEKLKEQWQVSKQLLPYLKVYQIHSATLETGVLENEAVLNYLSYLKNTHHIKMGISTTGANQVEVIKKALDVKVDGENLFDIFQVTYNLLDQSLKEVSSLLQKENKTIVIKEALANGRVFRNKNYPNYNDMYMALERLAQVHDVGIDAICLQYVAQTIPGSKVLSGASSSEQIQENLKMNGFVLSQLELDELSGFKVDGTQYWAERKALQWN
ncbi:Predicted oxidoreductase [Algibacter lectus]|uniref:aldo/keto reductase n=1 Tax=Algibacter lectus TaxID=221126 RepID=UPI0008F2D1F5|nr:aldo/keto reductase [Algibacter lectus]SFC80508.1 Predicted oxidoreductase [Algibacter lectus]